MNKSINLAELAEKLVKDKILGSRKGLPDSLNYLHSFRVRDLVRTYSPGQAEVSDLYLAALLHDVVEDGGVTFEELKQLGFSERTIELVGLCSHDLSVKDGTQRWVMMVSRLAQASDADAWRIKLADLADNLTQSKYLSPENRKFMIEVKALLLLRLGKVSESAWSLLEDEAKRQRQDMENY